MQGKKHANVDGTTRVTIQFLLLVAAVFLLVAGCREEQANDEPPTATPVVVVAATAVPTEPAVVEPETILIPEIEGKIAITSNDAVGVTAVAADDLATAGLETLPATVTLVSDVFVLEGVETAVNGQIAINTPDDADASLLDVYGWDGTAWVFIPSQYDAATQQRQTANDTLYQAVALVQIDAPDPITVGGVWQEGAAELTEAIVGTVYLDADGELAGSLADSPDDLANPYLAVTNVSDEVESDALAELLADEAAQTAQIEAVVEMAESYAGVNLNYQGLDAEQQAAFTTFVQTLAAALAAQDKRLILTLPAPQDTAVLEGLDDNWTALGRIADTVYLQMPLDPQAYGEGGAVAQLLIWATDNIDRRKLVALLPNGPVTQVDDTWTALTLDDLLSHFGDLELADETEEIEPETAVAVALSGDVSSIEWDEASAAYRFTIADDQEVWLLPATTMAARMETAVAHNLQGVAFTSPVQSPTTGEAVDPAIVWTILDSEENVIVSESSTETSFTWEASADPGEFTVQAEFVSDEGTLALGELPLTVAAAENTVELASGDVVTVVAAGIVKRNANVRIGPGESFAMFPGPVLKDVEVGIVGRDEFGYWLQIVFTDINGNQIGWIATSLLDLDEAFAMSDLEDTSNIISEAPSSTVASAPSTPAPAATPAPSAGPPPPVSAPPVAVGSFELGGQTHTFANPVLMASAGMTWVKFQHKWGEGGNPNDLAGRIASAHAAGFKVLLSIPGSNTYPDHINFGEYVQFLAGVAALGPDAIEVWNEMNIDFEWPAGQIDPAGYVNNMLAPAYNAIKAANPNVMVISGAPAPTGFDNGTNAWADNRYMAGMLAAGGGNYADCIGAHYNAGASSPSTVSGHPTGSAHYSWYLLPTLNVYAQLGKPVCFTELGYLSGEDYGGVPERFGWAAGTTVAQHAAWLAEAVSVAANTGKVRLIIVFNVDFTYWGDDPQAGYAMIRKDGSCPACTTLARVMGR
ncbi:MAG: hypothetical protein H6657_18360 [Ardenticatenaceae bacterium]|nr:hypothetical protein [Ardenticatenaceae bacterium]